MKEIKFRDWRVLTLPDTVKNVTPTWQDTWDIELKNWKKLKLDSEFFKKVIEKKNAIENMIPEDTKVEAPTQEQTNKKDVLKEAIEKKNAEQKIDAEKLAAAKEQAKKDMYSKQPEAKVETPKVEVETPESIEKKAEVKSTSDKVDDAFKWADKADDIIDKWSNASTLNKASKFKKLTQTIAKIPWGKLILATWKAVWKYAWPIWVLYAIWDWLTDVRWDKLKDDDKSRLQLAWQFINDLVWKTVINTAASTAEFLTVAPAWAWWQIKDIWNEFTWTKEERETDQSDKAIEARKWTAWKWIKSLREKALNLNDELTYWKWAVDDVNRYNDDYEEEIKETNWTQWTTDDFESLVNWIHKQSIQLNRQDNKEIKESDIQSKWNELGRRIVKNEDWTLWYISELNNEVKWNFKSLSDLEDDVNKWKQSFNQYRDQERKNISDKVEAELSKKGNKLSADKIKQAEFDKNKDLYKSKWVTYENLFG